MASTEVVVPILFRHAPGDWEQAGSGFIIAAMGNSALVVTAGHVVEAVCSRTRKPVARTLFRDGSEDKDPVRAGDEHDLVVLFQKDGVVLHANAWMGWGSKAHDLAVLAVDLPPNAEPLLEQQLAINPDGPAVGEEVYVFGYFDGRDTTSDLIPPGFEALLQNIAGELPQQIGIRMAVERGTVLQDYPEGTGLVRAPCFSLDVPFHSGMSGGLIFQRINGRSVACGLVSSDEASGSGDTVGTGGHPIAAKLAPLFFMLLDVEGVEPLTYERDGLTVTEIGSLQDLVALGVIEIVQPGFAGIDDV